MPVDDVYTVALLHMNGADASTTFTDESGKTWTANGNAQIDTAQSVFGGASGLFDGTGDFISSADSNDWQFDGGSNSNEWTADFRIRFNGDPGTGNQGIFSQFVDANNYLSFILNNNTLRLTCVSVAVVQFDIINAWNPAGSTWYHVALVKQGTTGYKMFVDGVQVGSTQTDVSTIPNFAASLSIGVHNGLYLNGWLDEFRISKGIARWTANFTPPSAEYTAPSENYFFMAF